jgi:secondary thiamine-phosphate synthase enzyme
MVETIDHQETLQIRTRGRGLVDITGPIARVVSGSRVRLGLCVVFVSHTSASLVIQENADPAVQRDLDRFLSRLVPDGDSLFTHTAEGPDDMPAHVRAALTLTSQTIPVRDGQLVLGTWQAVYLWEHRHSPHARTVVVHVTGRP